MHKTLEWLFQHATETHKPVVWAEMLELEIMDPDGWRGHMRKDMDEKIGLVEFMDRLSVTTISVKSKQKCRECGQPIGDIHSVACSRRKILEALGIAHANIVVKNDCCNPIDNS